MKNRIYLIVGICLLFVPFQSKAQQQKQPNIVIIYADDMGYGEVHGLNPERGKVPTPNLDRMITEGMTFTDAHTASAVCTPSRYALLTGRYAWRTRLQSGVLKGGGNPLVAENRLTLPGMLKEKGYDTVIAGKWHLDFHYDGDRETVGTTIPDGPITRGFNQWFGFHHAREMHILCKDDKVAEIIEPIDMLPRVTDYAVDYINQKANSSKNGKPFFLYVALGSPHKPILPTKEWEGKSGLGKYGDFVMMTDGMAGKIIDAIDSNGLKDNTIVIFSSDNGTSKSANIPNLEKQGHYPSANLRGLKSDLWDGGHRVPFILRWPAGGVRPGTKCEQLIGVSDIMATCADLIDYKLPKNTAEDSFSFVPALSGTKIESTREGIVHHSGNGFFAIRKGKWKLLLASGSAGASNPKFDRNGPSIQLYNMEEDISEQKNLQEQYPEVVTELTELLESYVKNGRSTTGVVVKNDANIDIWKKNKVSKWEGEEKNKK
ncbi:MAG: arylsulfatase [Urechidicola sp.]|nr:arylsulfatase [Urechidicola sp.]